MSVPAALVTTLLLQTSIAELPRDGRGGSCWLVHALGDVDGDGVVDVAVADPEGWHNVVVRSGASGKNLGGWTVAYDRFGDGNSWSAHESGAALVQVRDTSGATEYVLGAPGAGREGRACGALEMFAGLTNGSARLRARGKDGGDGFGASLAALGDVDGDGAEDVLVGAPNAPSPHVLVVSARTGAPIASASSSTPRFGCAVAAVKWRGNPQPLLAVGSPLANEGAGAVVLFAPKLGEKLDTIPGPTSRGQFGARLTAADLDGDGTDELLVGALGVESERPGRVVALRQDGWEPLWSHELPACENEHGLTLGTLGDLDGDARREVLVAFVPADARIRPGFRVLSGATGVMLHEIQSIDDDTPGDAGAGTTRFRPDEHGTALGNRLSFAAAGDHDGDGKEDLWFGVGSAGQKSLRARICLLPGGQLVGGAESATEVPKPRTTLPWKALDEPALPEPIQVDSLPSLFVDSRGDKLDDNARVFTCTDSAWGSRIESLGDLDGDGFDELWIAGISSVTRDWISHVYSRDGRSLQALDGARATDIARIGDLDGDDVPELALGVTERTYRFCESLGRVRVHLDALERKDRYFELKHPTDAYDYGAAIETIGDINGDGQPELAVGMPSVATLASLEMRVPPLRNEVTLVSLGSGTSTTLITLYGDASAADAFGRTLAWGGDFDGDGAADLAVGAPRSSAAGTLAGAVHVFSGANWKRIETFASAFPVGAFGQTILWAPDLDGDGRGELVVGAPLQGDDRHGCVYVLGSKERAPLVTLRGPWAFSGFGASLALGDLDGDGAFELVVGAPGTWDGAHLRRPSVLVFDLTSGRCRARFVDDGHEPVDVREDEEWDWRGSPYDSPERFLPQFGRALALANLDGDKLADLVIGAPSYQGPKDAGRVIAISGAVLSRVLAATK